MKDYEIRRIIKLEKKRQNDNLELIASENYASKEVRMAAGSILTNKYAEGYPKKRYYGGCEYVDGVENLAKSRLKNYLMLNMLMYNHIRDHRPTWLVIGL